MRIRSGYTSRASARDRDKCASLGGYRSRAGGDRADWLRIIRVGGWRGRLARVRSGARQRAARSTCGGPGNAGGPVHADADGPFSAPGDPEHARARRTLAPWSSRATTWPSLSARPRAGFCPFHRPSPAAVLRLGRAETGTGVDLAAGWLPAARGFRKTPGTAESTGHRRTG